ncbi:MAG TPA: peptide ABC transporter substrate-binding protein [Actinobacteria bacterium]|nr:peptide ABC transporter substrate-binding protein [Actinomycetota bacterium]
MIIGTTDTIAEFDSADAYSVRDWEIIRNTGVGLLTFAPGTTDLVPGIAKSYDVSDDGKTYTFHLRDDVKFGDGLALTAPMYVDHINRMLTLDGSGGVGGALGTPYIDTVSAPDDLTVVFQLKDAFGYFPQIVAGAPYIPMDPNQFPQDALVEFPDPPFYGVGPWTVTDYTIGEQMVLEPNEFYFGEKPKVDRIIIKDYSDAQTMALALQNHEIDIAWRTIAQPDLLEQLKGVDGLTVATVPGGSIRYLIINHALSPTDDSNVRKALAYALDRDDIVDRVSGGTWEPLYSMDPPGFLGANEAFDTMYGSPNLDKAKEALTAAGYSESNKLELQLSFPPQHYGGTVSDTMQVLKEQFEATGMINITLNSQEWSTYIGAVIGGADYTVSLLGWFFDYPDPSNYLEPFTLNGGLGTMVTDPDTGKPLSDEAANLVDLLKQAATSTDQAKRADLYGQAQDVYADLVVTIPMWFEAEHVVYWDNISGSPTDANPESLNIGPSFDFNYNLLDITG